jgi:hypothetical protein
MSCIILASRRLERLERIRRSIDGGISASVRLSVNAGMSGEICDLLQWCRIVSNSHVLKLL